MRCPDCNKFVSYDEPECEVNSVEVSDRSLTGSVTVNLNCSECGNLLKSAEFDVETDVDHACKPEAERDREWKPDPGYANDKGGEEQFTVDKEGDAEGTSRVQTTDRNGKPIKSARYMKSFYGFELSSEIFCRACGETFDVKTADDMQASHFEEQV